MDPVLQIAEGVSNVLYILLALASLRSWLSHRDAASAWLAVTFASLGSIVAAGIVAGDDPIPLYTAVSITILAVFPYFLLRFAGSFNPIGRRLHVAALVATAIVAVVGVVLIGGMRLPGPEEPATTVSTLYSLAFVVQWLGILGAAAVMLWRAGGGQPAIARRRMRLMAGASVVIVMALAVAASGATDPAVRLVGQLLGISSAVLFYLGFATPTWLRATWRAEAEDELYQAAVALMKARTMSEVAEVLVPHVARVIGADAVELRTHDGDVARHGVPSGEPSRTVPLLRATLDIWGSPYAPFFGEEEERLLSRLGLLTDLALDRTALLLAEQRARAEVEVVNDELESFVYSASHDLKTPLIAFLGYLDLLVVDHGQALPDDARLFLDRMRSNGLHMQELIRDLLELSRVGRVDTPPELVDIAAVVRSVADDLASTHPHARITVEDRLPPLWLNATRARQLVVNVLANAMKHGGRQDITVHVSATALPAGRVELRFQDDGVGVPEEHLERITRVFERLERETSGTGMGLAIVRKICIEAGGDLHFEPCDTGADLRMALPSGPGLPTVTSGRALDGARPSQGSEVVS